MNTIACYGSLKSGYGNHRLLEKSIFLGEDTLEGWKMVSLGSFPGVFKGEGSILVEIYDVTDRELSALDCLEGFPNFYNRTQVSTEFGKAWIYFLKEEDYANSEPVEGGNW